LPDFDVFILQVGSECLSLAVLFRKKRCFPVLCDSHYFISYITYINKFVTIFFENTSVYFAIDPKKNYFNRNIPVFNIEYLNTSYLLKASSIRHL
jgi:hypothetical protein